MHLFIKNATSHHCWCDTNRDVVAYVVEGFEMPHHRWLSPLVMNIYRPETWEMEAVALDAEEAVEVEVSPPPRALIWLESMKIGLVSGLCSNKPLLFSKTTTSDIVGLCAGVACVHFRAISITFFTSSASYSSGSRLSSTNSRCFSSS